MMSGRSDAMMITAMMKVMMMKMIEMMDALVRLAV